MEITTIVTFLSYILLGISLSAPIGPINIAQINRGLKYGFLSAWFIGLGGMAADIVMMFIIYLGIAAFLTAPGVKLLMWLLGCIVLTYLGYDSIRHASDTIQYLDKNEKRESLFKTFSTGFIMAISNPLNIIFWIGIYGSLLAKLSDSMNRLLTLAYSSAIFIGISIWDITMATVIFFGRKKLKPKAAKWISMTAGVLLIGFGITFGWQMVISALHLVGITEGRPISIPSIKSMGIY